MVNKKHCFIAVEGAHDQAAIGKIIEIQKDNTGKKRFKKFKGNVNEIAELWKNLIPNTFPLDENIYERISLPSIFTSDTHSIAVFWGNGDELKPNIINTLNNLENLGEIYSFGIILDADKKNITQHVKSFIKDKAKETPIMSIRDFYPNFPIIPGEIFKDDNQRLGLYVLPDNSKEGTLEKILIECGNEVYKDLLDCAKGFLDCAKKDDKIKSKLENISNFNEDKAKVATIVSVLKPGKTNQTSIADDNWICEDTVQKVGDLKKLKDFLVELLDL